MVRCGLQFLHAQEVTHLINDTALKVSTPITQEPDWGLEDQDVTLTPYLGNCFNCLIGGHIHHNVLCEMVMEYQDIGNLRWSVQLQGCLYASKVHMQEVHRRIGHNWV